MRMVGAGMTAAVLLAGLAASMASAQDSDGDLHSAAPKSKAIWDGWFTPAAKPPEKPHDDAGPPTPLGPSPVELAAAARQAERAALDRRWEVCDRLMEIAVRNSDEAMQKQVEELRDRAWDVYQQRTAALPDDKSAGPKAPPTREVKP